MSDKPEKTPQTQPDSRRTPPHPPKKAAHDLGDGGEKRGVRVHFHLVGNGLKPLARVCFGPFENGHVLRWIRLRHLPPILVSLYYSAATDELELTAESPEGQRLTFTSKGPKNTRMTLPVNNQNTIEVVVHRGDDMS